MPQNSVRLLQNKWESDSGWPKRLEWLEISGIRGWTGQRIDLRFPIVAICGENGSGKSTILQAAASLYAAPQEGADKGSFASDFFPDTQWERVENASLRGLIREGEHSLMVSVRKPTTRWRGNPERPERRVVYIDLTRIQPVPSRVGYQRLANPNALETSANTFDTELVSRLSEIMGRQYGGARMALTNLDDNRAVPVLTLASNTASGFHLGAGETTVAEFLGTTLPKYSLVLIDEVETSLHPSSQRRLIRDLAELARTRELQIILTTHSPYVLAELPPTARAYIFQNPEEKRLVVGVSPEFALTVMDEQPHPECDLYVEDERGEQMLREILVAAFGNEVPRFRTIKYGAASVGKALGEMVSKGRFPTPSVVFVDGDQPDLSGCMRLPGGDAPEAVVFSALQRVGWAGVADRLGRPHPEVADACMRAMATKDHHEWVATAAQKLSVSTDMLWTVLCQIWVERGLSRMELDAITNVVRDTLVSKKFSPPPVPTAPPPPYEPPQNAPPSKEQPPWLFPP